MRCCCGNWWLNKKRLCSQAVKLVVYRALRVYGLKNEGLSSLHYRVSIGEADKRRLINGVLILSRFCSTRCLHFQHMVGHESRSSSEVRPLTGWFLLSTGRPQIKE